MSSARVNMDKVPEIRRERDTRAPLVCTQPDDPVRSECSSQTSVKPITQARTRRLTPSHGGLSDQTGESTNQSATPSASNA